MVTKVTADVMNLASPVVNTFTLQGGGLSSLDSTPIGVTTPDIGIFTNLTATNLTVTGTSILAGAVPILNGVMGASIQPYSIINSSDGIPFINNSNAPITIVSGITSALLLTDGFTKLGDYVKYIIPLALVGNTISHGGMVLASDNRRVFINNTLSNIVITGGTAANLIASGFTDMGNHIGRPFINVAYLGTSIPSNAIVLSSDNILMINNLGVSTIPSTGTATAANLITDGFTTLQAYIATPASTTVSGITSIATNAEALLGTNTTKIITPATLNSTITQAVAGSLSFKGVYNAATNTPNLLTPAAGVVGVGDYYVVSVAGTFFGTSFNVGDSLFSTVNNPTVLGDWTTVQVNVAYTTTLSQGLITLATAAEVQAGIEATKAVTSSTLHNTTNTPILTKSGILNTALATPAQISAGTVNDTIAIDFGGISVARTKISDVMAIANISAGAIITDAVIATAVANNKIVISSDGVPMINNTGISTSPTTGTATAANLITDGFTNLQTYITTPASTIISGIAPLATNAEALLGTNTTKIITPATLNSTITQAITGSLTFRGSYNAATNTPNLLTPAAGAVGIGDYYVVSVAGTFFGNTLSVGDSLFSTVVNPTVFGDWTTVQVNVAYSTTLSQGLITLATAAEVQAGLEATKAVTSSTLHNTTNTPILTKSGILNTALATPAQISAGTVNDTIAIDFGGISVARTKISDVMAIANISAGAIITDAVIATAVTSNEIVVSSDGVPMINNTGVGIIPVTGTATAANLITDGLVSVSNYMLTKFSQVTETVVTGNGVITTSPTGTTTVVPQTQVEVFWNGIRQIAGTDYSVAGTTITFTSAIPLGLKAYIRVTH